MSAYLTWMEARAQAQAGKLIRREDWPLPGSDRAWLRRRAVLWEALDKNLASLGIVEAAEFTSAEFFAEDWTTDEIGAVRDVCRRPSRPLYAPPGLRLTGSVTAQTLHLDLGDSAPSGAYWVTFLVNGIEIETIEAPEPGRYSLSDPAELIAAAIAGEVYAEARVKSISPLPEWESVAVWRYIAPALDFFEIDISADFPLRNDVTSWYGARTYGPYSDDRFIYSHSDEPIAFYLSATTGFPTFYPLSTDDLYIDGILSGDPTYYWVGAEWVGGKPFGSQTTLIKFLPAGGTFVVDIQSSDATSGFSQGKLRLSNRLL